MCFYVCVVFKYVYSNHSKIYVYFVFNYDLSFFLFSFIRFQSDLLQTKKRSLLLHTSEYSALQGICILSWHNKNANCARWILGTAQRPARSSARTMCCTAVERFDCACFVCGGCSGGPTVIWLYAVGAVRVRTTCTFYFAFVLRCIQLHLYTFIRLQYQREHRSFMQSNLMVGLKMVDADVFLSVEYHQILYAQIRGRQPSTQHS